MEDSGAGFLTRAMSRDLNWVMLRPLVVMSAAAYGGSALFYGLAARPVLPVMPDSGLLQPGSAL
jgi:hypothetical protein